MLLARLQDLITEPDNKTLCPVRIAALAGCLEFLGCSAWGLHKTGTFDPQAYALGFAALLGGMGAALGLKKDTPREK